MDKACKVYCPPVCESVFERVVVSHLIKGGTKVMWELLDTFLDPAPLLFQLQVGTTDNPDADDWENVGLPVEDQYVAVDPDQRVWGKTNWTFYRIKLVTAISTYYSTPVGGMGVLNRRDWRLAREILRQRKLIYKWGEAQRGYLLKRRVTGTKCTTCTDYQTEESLNPDCPSCYGTGFECGYFYPMSCVWAKTNPKGYHVNLDGQRGTVNDIVVQSEMLMTELVMEQDVWVNAVTDDRYFVHEVQHIAEVRGVPLIGMVSLRPIPYSSIIYTIEIPQQLAELATF